MFKKFRISENKVYNVSSNIFETILSKPTDNFIKLIDEVAEIMIGWEYVSKFIKRIDINYHVWLGVFFGSIRIIKIEEI